MGASRLPGGRVDGYKVLGEGLGTGFEGGGRVRQRKGRDEQSVTVVLHNVAWLGLCASNQTDAAQDDGVWEGSLEGLLDVEAVLDEDEGGVGVVRGEGGRDELGERGRDIGGVFCGKDYVVVWVQAFFFDIRNGVEDWLC